MIQTGNVNDLKTGIGTGEAQVLEGFKVTPASNDAANNILANRKLESDKAEKKAKEEQGAYGRLNMDLKGTMIRDNNHLRSLMGDTWLKMKQDSNEGKLNTNSQEYFERLNSIADAIELSRANEKQRQEEDKLSKDPRVLAGTSRLTPQAKKDFSALNSDNASEGVENHDAWVKNSTVQLNNSRASSILQPQFSPTRYKSELGKTAHSIDQSTESLVRVPDPNDPSREISISTENYDPSSRIKIDFNAPNVYGVGMQDYYKEFLDSPNNAELATKYKYIQGATDQKDLMNNLKAAEQFAIDDNEPHGRLAKNTETSKSLGNPKNTSFSFNNSGGASVTKNDITYDITKPSTENLGFDDYNKNYNLAKQNGADQSNLYDEFSQRLNGATYNVSKSNKDLPKKPFVDIQGNAVYAIPEQFREDKNGNKYILGYEISPEHTNQKVGDISVSTSSDKVKKIVIPYDASNKSVLNSMLENDVSQIANEGYKVIGKGKKGSAQQTTGIKPPTNKPSKGKLY